MFKIFFSDAVLLSMSVILLSMVAFTAALPSGFVSEIVSDVNAVSGAFAPHPQTGDPILVLVSKSGKVHALLDPDSLSSKAPKILDLEGKMCTNGERGLQNVAIHPNFEENRYVYLFYTTFKEDCLKDEDEPESAHPHNVVERFTMDPDTLLLDYDSREEIWRGAPLHGNHANHNGGAMAFGNDGKLYVTHGDGGVQERSQDMSTVLGSLLRLNDDGTSPDDNPFTATNGYESYHCGDSEGKLPAGAGVDAICSEIFSIGFRNPFRIALDPNEKEKVRFSISDVGGKTWEELSYGGTDYAGMNYGWKPHEGPCLRHSSVECPLPDDPNNVEPFHYYMHRDGGGGCVSGAAFVPEGLDWPEEYKFFFADFLFYELYSLTESPADECRTCSPPVSRFKNETFFEPVRYPGEGKNQGRLVDLFFGPYNDTQALYVITYGDIETIQRIRYTGIHNDPPLANFTASKLNVDVNEEVQFDASGSYDPEGENITFQWFFGDDTRPATSMAPTHSYEKRGMYEVTLFVRDAINQLQQRSMTIIVGELPNATILSPSEGDEFYVGQVLRLEGEAYYPNGTAFTESQLQWEVRKHHDDHYHPFLDPTFGNNIDLSPAPEPEDFFASTNSYLEVILYATDGDGLTRKISRNIQPSLLEVGINSNLAGLKIEVNGERVSTSSKIVSWKDQKINLEADSDPSYRFVSWSDGFEGASRSAILNYSDPVFTANFCALTGSICSDEIPCCTGFCLEDVTDAFPQKIKSSQNTAKSGLICFDETGSPTQTQSPTAQSPTAAPGVSPAPSQAESAASAITSMNLLLVLASVTIAVFVNV